ncbi:MAG: phosphoribosylformylglycinamidine synthase subunit PurL [Acidimicrobiales bacterium]
MDAAAQFGVEVDAIAEFRVAHLRGTVTVEGLAVVADRLLVDPVDGWWVVAGDHQTDGLVIETGLRPGVTDREGAELARGARELGLDVSAATIGRRFVVHGDLRADDVTTLAQRVLHNEVIERWRLGALPAAFIDEVSLLPGVETIGIRRLSDERLLELGASRRLGLDLRELEAIRQHYGALGRDPTDAELETFAQTWSEHCSHKTFGALIQMGEETIDGLLRSFIVAATDEIAAPWVHSAFVDNAGIVQFDDEFDIALKAETHNHPSALEPFGGANTGVGGVVRDILGVSARPIAITDVLCFGPEDTPRESLPPGVLHPGRVRDGVIAGVGDYGNKIGVPNIAGAILHDPAYMTTPLVFAGCLGVLPTGSNPTSAAAGDTIVVLGGAVGRDGVGGATFSSQAMEAATAETAGSSVQIGDPVLEKGLIDVIIAARDERLYTAITDCGAGGLSSAVGEMAEQLGCVVDLALVPRKYQGLAPWEVWLSEAQERMVVATATPESLIELAKRWGVDATAIGHFTGDGRLTVTEGDVVVIDIDCAFLHGGRPRQTLAAKVAEVVRPQRALPPLDRREVTLALLAHPSIRSNERVVRTYDHEIMGGTIVRPYGGVAGDGPGDGTALIPPGTSGDRAVVVGIGVNAVLGRFDAHAMAWHVIDEAVRNAVIAGADPSRLSLLDNFAWGDPTDPDTLGSLVEACRGCRDAAVAHGAPFVSGKDSLYNVFVDEDGNSDPVAPTLVITAVGVARELGNVPLTGVVEPGHDVWLVGSLRGALGGSHLDVVLGGDHGGAVPQPDPGAIERHRGVHSAIGAGLVASAHDLAEGGLAVAAAEWAWAGRLGLSLDVDDDPETLFGEGSGRYLLEVSPRNSSEFGALLPSAHKVGVTTERPIVSIGSLSLSLDEIGRAYTGNQPGRSL